jgi:1-acyl-sn-glycerol-3-phosphate acyltransferase
MRYQFSRVIVGPLLRAYGRPRLTGDSNIPAAGSAILASNHLSVIDSIYLPWAPGAQLGRAGYSGRDDRHQAR